MKISRQMILAAVLIALAVLTMTGCATGPQRIKAENPARQAALDKALDECNYELAMAIRTPRDVPQGHWLAQVDISDQRKEMLAACMRRKGWEIPAQY